MLSIPPTSKLWYCGAIDLRLGFDGLYRHVQSTLQADPLSGHLFIYTNSIGRFYPLWVLPTMPVILGHRPLPQWAGESRTRWRKSTPNSGRSSSARAAASMCRR